MSDNYDDKYDDELYSIPDDMFEDPDDSYDSYDSFGGYGGYGEENKSNMNKNNINKNNMNKNNMDKRNMHKSSINKSYMNNTNNKDTENTDTKNKDTENTTSDIRTTDSEAEEKRERKLYVDWFYREIKLNKYSLGITFYSGAVLFIKNALNSDASDPDILHIVGMADYDELEPGETVYDIARRARMPHERTLNNRLSHRFNNRLNNTNNKKIYDDILIIRPSLSKEEEEAANPKGIAMNKAFRESIRVWLERTNYNAFAHAIKQRVKGQEQLDRVLINVYSYMENMAAGRPHNNNILIAAPSGCGKTETFRAIRDYFAKILPTMPIYQVDMTSITEEGFKGKDTKAVVSELETEYGTDGIGIVFLDEFDKKLLPSHDSKGNNINKAVQSQLLTTFEGVKYTDMGIDTNNTLFIALGAFDTCRENKSEEIKHIGFGAVNEGGEDHYAAINRQDIIDLGASYELLGRFGTIVNYHKLSKEVVDRIINGMAKEVGQSIGSYVKISDDFRNELRENANSKFGCRLLKSMINDSAMEAYLEIQKKGKKNKQLTIELQGENKYKLVERAG